MIIEKIRTFIKSLDISQKNLYLSLFIVIIAFLSYGLGKLSVLEGSEYPVRIENIKDVDNSNKKENFNLKESVSKEALKQGGLLVGSKKGSKYHYPWCPGANRIKDENKIWFSSESNARERGYTPAANCSGL